MSEEEPTLSPQLAEVLSRLPDLPGVKAAPDLTLDGLRIAAVLTSAARSA